MSDLQPDPEPLSATGFVERAIEQPVKRAVREALAEHEAERAAVRSDETSGDDSKAEREVDPTSRTTPLTPVV